MVHTAHAWHLPERLLYLRPAPRASSAGRTDHLHILCLCRSPSDHLDKVPWRGGELNLSSINIKNSPTQATHSVVESCGRPIDTQAGPLGHSRGDIAQCG